MPGGHRVLIIEIQVLQFVRKNAICNSLCQSRRHTDTKSETESAAASMEETACAGLVSLAAYSAKGEG